MNLLQTIEAESIAAISKDIPDFRPGDTLRVKVSKQRNRGTVWKFLGEAHVADKLVAEATFGAMILDD